MCVGISLPGGFLQPVDNDGVIMLLAQAVGGKTGEKKLGAGIALIGCLPTPFVGLVPIVGNAPPARIHDGKRELCV